MWWYVKKQWNCHWTFIKVHVVSLPVTLENTTYSHNSPTYLKSILGVLIMGMRIDETASHKFIQNYFAINIFIFKIFIHLTIWNIIYSWLICVSINRFVLLGHTSHISKSRVYEWEKHCNQSQNKQNYIYLHIHIGYRVWTHI